MHADSCLVPLTSGCVLTGVAKVESMATMAPCTGATHVSTVSARALRMCAQLLQCKSAASLCRPVPGDGLVSGPLWCGLCCCPISCPAHLLVAQLCDARHIHTPHVCRQAGGAAGRCVVTPAVHNNSVGRMHFGSPWQHSFAAPAAAPCLQLTRVCRILAEEQRHLRAGIHIAALWPHRQTSGQVLLHLCVVSRRPPAWNHAFQSAQLTGYRSSASSSAARSEGSITVAPMPIFGRNCWMNCRRKEREWGGALSMPGRQRQQCRWRRRLFPARPHESMKRNCLSAGKRSAGTRLQLSICPPSAAPTWRVRR